MGGLFVLRFVCAAADGSWFLFRLQYSINMKGALMRIGLDEMRRFASTFFDDVKVESILESCGVGDLITTCFGGRHHRCAMRCVVSGRDFQEVSLELLGEHKLQVRAAACSCGGLLCNTEWGSFVWASSCFRWC